MHPPNWMQICVYNALQKVQMGMHRDNYKREGLDWMKAGGLPYNENDRYAGVKNSQVHGSNVIVYTMCNSPMEMIFSHPNPEDQVTQETKKYIRHPCFSFKLADGHLSVLDPIDDVLMLHGIRWEDLQLSGAVMSDGVEDLRNRVAFVMRRCENMKDFYTDMSAIRPDDHMIKAMSKSIANNKVKKGMGRGIL